jgi:asparaginyl-tRNA synthetase
MATMEHIDAFERRMGSDELEAIATVTNRAVTSLQETAAKAGFIQIMPVLLSPFTDPLNHSVYPADVEYEGRRLKLTASMIFHKQLALSMLKVDKIFIVSPNIRLEKACVKSSSNHLLEFSQFDLEMRDATMHDVMSFVDGLVRNAIETVRKDCAHELSALRRTLPDYPGPFKIYPSEQIRAQYGEDFEKKVSKISAAPCFVTNFKREFYDQETPGQRGHYNNFDLIYPEGYGEALSGAEREYEHDQILYRMRELHMDLEPYANYLEMARRKLIPRTAGAGLGIQRFIRFICGTREIKDVCLFDRSIASNFAF